MAGLATIFGSGTMTNTINELEQAQVILVSGSNTTVTHPQVARRIFDAVDRGAKLIVIDPRKTKIARHAHIHLQICPGTDIPLINAIMRCILDENLTDDLFIEMRTENYPALRDLLFQVNLKQAAEICGVTAEDIGQAARMYARAQRAAICYCLGVTQPACCRGNVESYTNLAMLTGHVEQEFTGVDALRGQYNVQGACDMGALPEFFPGYQAVADPEIRKKFEKAWACTLPENPGLTVVEMLHGAPEEDRLQAMLIMGENPMLSQPNLGRVRSVLQNLDFLVVTDIFLTETAELADVVLPAACFAEKTGTVTNSERRVQLSHKAVEPPGQARADDWIIQELSTRMGYPMQYESPREIMEEICLLTPIYGGIYHDRLHASWGLQWPCPDRKHPGTPFLHKDSLTGRLNRFEPKQHVPPVEPEDKDFPFVLLTGRRYHQYHTGTMTRRCATLNRECNTPLLDMHPEDAQRLGLTNGCRIRVQSRQGSVPFTLHLSTHMNLGELYCDFHFHEAPTNVLTMTGNDPVASCPQYKSCAVNVEVEND